MKRTCSIFLLYWIIFFSSIPSAFSSGFLIIEQGAKSMAMAGAFTAIADDPSTMFNNPAGITQIPGSRVSIGNTFIRNDQKYEVPSDLFPGFTYDEKMDSRTFFLPHFYVTHQMNEKVTLGFGYNTPFGVGANWSDESVGNSTANETHVKSYDFNPNIAFKVNPRLSLAVGAHYLRFKTQIIRQVGLPGLPAVASYETAVLLGLGPQQLGRLKIDARGGGWAYNVALLYELNDYWKVGFHYRSDMDIDISRSESTVDFVPNPLTGIPFRSHTYGKTDVGLPGIFFAGIATTAITKWNLAFDLQYTTWNHFDDIEITVEPDLVIGMNSLRNLPALEEDWENTWSFHFGAEYQYTENFAVRTGYFYDKTPIPDRTLGAILPGSDRHNFSLGCGYTRGDWTLDAAYLWSNFENRSTRTNYEGFNASYDSNFHLLGLTLTRTL